MVGEHFSRYAVVDISAMTSFNDFQWFEGVCVVICLALIKTRSYHHSIFTLCCPNVHSCLTTSIMMFICLPPPVLISHTLSLLVIVPRGSIRLLTSLRCNYSLNQDNPESVRRKQKCSCHKQESH